MRKDSKLERRKAEKATIRTNTQIPEPQNITPEQITHKKADALSTMAIDT